VAQTIGRRWPAKHLNGDNVEYCAICGCKYQRSKLRRDRGGNLVCPSDWGKDANWLDEENARLARKTRIPVRGDQ
jgi:hypothetical protein